jgi:transposase
MKNTSSPSKGSGSWSTSGLIRPLGISICSSSGSRLLLLKHRTKRHCRRLVPILLRYIERLRAWGLKPLIQLAETIDSWKEEIARMWRFTKNNGITEGFHTKMEMISRRAFGFRNFENYRLRVKVLCG